jgi:hypothetical protein
VVKRQSWLTLRTDLSDWLHPNQAENKSRVSLQYQSFALCDSPLFMAVLPSTLGLTTVASEMPARKGFIYRDKFNPEDHMEGLWDELATESGIVLVDEETGESLGITIGGSSTFSGMALFEDPDTAAFTGQITDGPAGNLYAFEALDIASFTGGVANVGSLIAAEGPDTAAFTGTVIDLATGSLIVTEAQDIAAFTATLGADIDMDFVTGTYVGANPAGLTVTRNLVSYAVDNSGDYIQFAANQARITNLGLLMENPSANAIRNNSMQGAGPGVPPTNWSINSSLGFGITIVGVGTENGVDYLELGFGPNTTYTISFEPVGAVAAVNGQPWTLSAFAKIQSGSLGTGTVKLVQNYYNSSSALLGTVSSPALPVTTAALGPQRFVFEAVAGVVGLAFIQPQLIIVGGGFNIRIGWPQLEQQSWASSPIRTTGAAVSRPADTIKVTTTPVFGAVASLYAEGYLLGPGANKAILSFDNGSSFNRMLIYTDGVGAFGFDTAGGVPISNLNLPGWTPGASAKAVFAVASGAQNLVLNGSAPASSASIGTVVPAGTDIWIGSQFGSTMLWEGRIKRVSVWRNAALSVLEMQQITQ